MAEKMTVDEAARVLYETYRANSLGLLIGLDGAMPWKSLRPHVKATWYKVLAKSMEIAKKVAKDGN